VGFAKKTVLGQKREKNSETSEHDLRNSQVVEVETKGTGGVSSGWTKKRNRQGEKKVSLKLKQKTIRLWLLPFSERAGGYGTN